MGQLLRGFLKDGDCDGCAGDGNQQTMVINFVNAQPTDAEKEVYDEAEEFITDCEKLLEELKSFKGKLLVKYRIELIS